MLFESNEGAAESQFSGKIIESAQNLIGKKKTEKALPPSQTIPAETYVSPTQGNWRDTNDLVEGSVTDETTKLLNKDI
jgi:hypothetical protein